MVWLYHRIQMKAEWPNFPKVDEINATGEVATERHYIKDIPIVKSNKLRRHIRAKTGMQGHHCLVSTIYL